MLSDEILKINEEKSVKAPPREIQYDFLVNKINEIQSMEETDTNHGKETFHDDETTGAEPELERLSEISTLDKPEEEQEELASEADLNVQPIPDLEEVNDGIRLMNDPGLPDETAQLGIEVNADRDEVETHPDDSSKVIENMTSLLVQKCFKVEEDLLDLIEEMKEIEKEGRNVDENELDKSDALELTGNDEEKNLYCQQNEDKTQDFGSVGVDLKDDCQEIKETAIEEESKAEKLDENFQILEKNSDREDQNDSTPKSSIETSTNTEDLIDNCNLDYQVKTVKLRVL